MLPLEHPRPLPWVTSNNPLADPWKLALRSPVRKPRGTGIGLPIRKIHRLCNPGLLPRLISHRGPHLRRRLRFGEHCPPRRPLAAAHDRAMHQRGLPHRSLPLTTLPRYTSNSGPAIFII